MIKNLSILFFLFFSFPALAGQGMGPGPGVKGYAAVSCTTSNDSALVDYTGLTLNNTSYLYAGADSSSRFPITGTNTITRYKLVVHTVSTGGTVTANLFTNSGGDLGTVISGTTATANVTASGTVEFDLSTPYTDLAAGTYWLQFTTSGDVNIQPWYGASSGQRAHDYTGYLADYSLGIAIYGCAQ